MSVAAPCRSVECSLLAEPTLLRLTLSLSQLLLMFMRAPSAPFVLAMMLFILVLSFFITFFPSVKL